MLEAVVIVVLAVPSIVWFVRDRRSKAADPNRPAPSAAPKHHWWQP
jgi:hypothetical protein